MKGYIGTNVSNAEEQEMEFLTHVQQFYLTQFPNPERTGCPTTKELMQLAWRRNLDQLRKVALHLTHCSPCCQQHHELAKKYREYVHSEKHQRVFKYKSIAIVTGIAALLLFGLGISMMTWQWLKVRAGHDGTNVQDSSNRKATPNLSNPNESGKTTEAGVPSLEHQSISLNLNSPLRDGHSSKMTALEVPRGRLSLSIQLPLGAREGKYLVRLSSHNKTLTQVEGTASTNQKGVTMLEVVDFDTSDVPPGKYELAFKRGPLEWTEFSVWVK